MARAKELLDLFTSPTAVVTGVLLAFARGQLARNNAGAVDRSMTIWALVASIAGALIAAGIVAVMWPLTWRITVSNRGPVETRLLVYGLTFLVAIGTAVYAGYIARKCKRDVWP